MKYKSLLLFVVLVAIVVSFNVVSCHKHRPENDGYSEWRELTEADSVIYAKARAAYLDDPANEGAADFKIMQFLSHNPFAVRTKAVESGMNCQFACRDEYVVTVYNGYGDEVGKVIEIQGASDYGTPVLPTYPQRRDTIPY